MMLTLGLADPARKAVSGQQSAVSRQAVDTLSETNL
jgi:hypothetical protein